MGALQLCLTRQHVAVQHWATCIVCLSHMSCNSACPAALWLNLTCGTHQAAEELAFAAGPCQSTMGKLMGMHPSMPSPSHKRWTRLSQSSWCLCNCPNL